MWLLRRCIELSLFVTLLVLLIIQQLRHTHHVRVLQSSGPVGYQLLRGRKWIMGPAIASGHGRATLLDLEFGGVLRSHHPLKQANQGVKSNEPRFHSSSSWGKRCWEPDQPHVLVAVPYNPAMPEFLQQVLAAHLARLECGNPGLNLELAITSVRPPKDDADPSGRGRIASVRNWIVESLVVPNTKLDFVFWLDADLTIVPPDIILRLYRANPRGISAPLVLLDKQGAETFRQTSWPTSVQSYFDSSISNDSMDRKTTTSRSYDDTTASETSTMAMMREWRFYDTAAFVQEGEPIEQNVATKHHANFGSVSAVPPYFRRPKRPLVDCDSVGTTYLIPAAVYRWNASLPSDGLHVGRAATIRHFAHVLTEHFPVVHAAKYILGYRVTALTTAAVAHAELPLFGEGYHGNAFDRARWGDIATFRRAPKGLASTTMIAKTAVEVFLRGKDHGGGYFALFGSPGRESDHKKVKGCLRNLIQAPQYATDVRAETKGRTEMASIAFRTLPSICS